MPQSTPGGGSSRGTVNVSTATPYKAKKNENVSNFTLYELAKGAGWNSAQAVIAAAIAYAESGGKLDAVGGPNSDGSEDLGLWQINSIHTQYKREWLLNDAEYNAKAAYEIYKSQGWKAWTQWRNKAYVPFLASAKDVKVSSHSHLQDATDATSLDPASVVKRTGLDAIGDLASKLMDIEFWKRAGFVILGGVLTTVAILILAAEFMRKVPTPVGKAISAVR